MTSALEGEARFEFADIGELPHYNADLGSPDNVATFIKELVLELPEGEAVPFKAGGYIQIECPPHVVKYADFDIEDEYREDWDKYDMWRYVSKVDTEVTRAYSMASYPEEKDIIMLNVRVASPPPRAPEGTPPGSGTGQRFRAAAGGQGRCRLTGDHGGREIPGGDGRTHAHRLTNHQDTLIV